MKKETQGTLPLDDHPLMKKAIGIISKALHFKDSKGRKFTEEQLDFLKPWSQELYELGVKASEEKYAKYSKAKVS